MSQEIITRLRHQLAALTPSRVDIEDESHRHAGHAGAREGGHYVLTIVAECFSGKTTVARHRLVYDAAGSLMRQGIHALSIHAFSPDEV